MMNNECIARCLSGPDCLPDKPSSGVLVDWLRLKIMSNSFLFPVTEAFNFLSGLLPDSGVRLMLLNVTCGYQLWQGSAPALSRS